MKDFFRLRMIVLTASAQLNALFRFSNILPFKAKFVLVQSFVYANCNYCPLVWNFSSSKSLMKVEKIHKRALYVFYTMTLKPLTRIFSLRQIKTV